MQKEKALAVILTGLACASGVFGEVFAADVAKIPDSAERAGSEGWKEELVDRLFHISTKEAAVETVLALEDDRMAELVVELIGNSEPTINVYNAYRIGCMSGSKRPVARKNIFKEFCPCVDGFFVGMEILRRAPEQLRRSTLLPALRACYDQTRDVDSKLNVHMALSVFDPAVAAQTKIDNYDIKPVPEHILNRNRTQALQPDQRRASSEWFYEITPPSDGSETATLLAEAIGRHESGYARNLGMALDTLCGAGGIPALLKLLEEKEWYPRRAAMATLEIMGPKARDVLPALEKHLADASEDIDVRVGAARAIARITGEDPFELYLRIPDCRKALVRTTIEKSKAWKPSHMEQEGARFNPTQNTAFHGTDGRAMYALATGQHSEKANRYIIDRCENFESGGWKGTWPIEFLAETLSLFHSKSRFYPGRLTPEAEQAMKTYVFKLSNGETKLPSRYIVTKVEAEDALTKRAADPSLVLTRNDNGFLTPHAFIFLACSVLMEDPDYTDRRFSSGETVAERYEVLNRWFKLAFRDWALSGLTPELGSTGYEVITWNLLFQLAHLSPDAELRKLAEMYLDVAVMEVEQISMNSVRSGYKSRPKGSWMASRLRPLRAMLFGERGGNPMQPSLTFSSYTPPEAAILLRKLGPPMPRYEIRNHYLGYLSETVASENHAFWEKNPRCLGYAYRTPAYILGSVQYDPNRPLFAGFASHWMGIFFDNLQAVSLPGYRGGMMAVQDKDALILQRISGTLWPGRPVVELTRGLEWVEREGWIFVDNTTAFAAIKVVTGGYLWNPEPIGPRQFWPNDPFSPIIVQAGSAQDYGSFEAFQDKVLAAKLKTVFAPDPKRENGQLLDRISYSAPGSRELTLYCDHDHFHCTRHYTPTARTELARIDGRPLDLDLKRTYDSPFLQLKASDDKVHIRYGKREWVYDFSELTVKQNEDGLFLRLFQRLF